jgi:hypothetical protein
MQNPEKPMDTSLRWYGDNNIGQKEARRKSGLPIFIYNAIIQSNFLICIFGMRSLKYPNQPE